MPKRETELAELVEAGAQQIAGALRAACDEGLSVPQLTELLGVALRQRNRFDAAVTHTIGAVDAAAEQAMEAGELTMGLSCATWLSWQLHMTDIENMRSLCGVHNRRLTGGWWLERLPDRQYAVHPPTAPGQPVIRRLSALGAGTRF